MTPSDAETRWREAVRDVLKGGDPEALQSRTRDGLAIPILSPPAAGSSGIGRKAVHHGLDIAVRVDHADPAEANRLLSEEVENGATALVLVGNGSWSARGFGLNAATLPDVLRGVDLAHCSVRIEADAGQRGDFVEGVLDHGRAQGLEADRLALDIGLDPAADDPAAIRAQATRWRERGLTGFVLRADGRAHHEAGGSEAQELAAVLSAGVAALRALEPLRLETVRDGLSFTLAADTDQLLTMAKLRALRRLWCRIEAACSLQPRPIRLHAETAWRMLARRDPHVNLVRNTIASAAAILGGADGLTVLPFTAAHGPPDAFARRLARNTALVLLEESGLGRVTDPAAGAGVVEALTAALSERAWSLFQELEAEGGIAAALRAGTWQERIALVRQQREADLRVGNGVLVGVNRFLPHENSKPAGSDTPQAGALSRFGLPSLREAALFEAAP